MLMSTNLDMHTISNSQFLSWFSHALHSKLLRYSVETAPLTDLMMILLFVIQIKLAFSMLWALRCFVTWKEATRIHSILKLGMDEENIGIHILLAAFSTSVILETEDSCRYLQPIASPHILERLQELWHWRQEIMTDHFDCNPFISTKQIHFPWTLSSADELEFSVKTPKQRCVLCRVTKSVLHPWRSSWCRQWSLANDSAHHAAGTCIWSDESLSRFFSCFA